MALSLPPPIIQKVARLRALQYKGSDLVLWDTPCILTPIQMEVYKNFILLKEFGSKCRPLQYLIAKLQAKTGVKIVNEKFGYADTLLDKKRLLDFNVGQFELLGHGKVDIIKLDFESLEFIFKTSSTYAQEYKSLVGLQKFPVDFTMAGLAAGCLEGVCGKQMFCLETRCIAKPIDKWNKKQINGFEKFLNKNYENQLATKWKIITK